MILHIDMNAYFATLEQQWNPALRGKPIIICGKGSGERTVVATASYEAKRKGVKNGMAVWQAKKLCPNVILVQAHYQKYLETTRKIIEILESFTPDVEVFSIDEAFIEINSNIEYRNSKQIQNSNDTNSKRFEFRNLDLDIVSDLGFRASDFEIQIAIQVALNIKNTIKQKIGELCTCSIGIAPNKLLAKIASECKKPDGLTIVRDYGLEVSKTSGITFLTKDALLNSIALDDVPGIGPRMLKRLNNLGLFTVKDLRELTIINYQLTIREFGPSYAEFLYNAARGIDNSPLVRFRDAPQEKSFGHSYTLPRDIYGLKKAKAVLLYLAEKVGRRMRAKGFLGKTIHVWLRFTDMTSWGQQTTIQQPTNNGYEIYKAGEKIIENWKLKIKNFKPVRAVGISCTNLAKTGQMSLFKPEQKQNTIPKILDAVNGKYGDNTLFRAETLPYFSVVENIPDGRNKREFIHSI